MYSVDVYLRVCRAVMVEGKSIREVSREFGLHRDTVRKMLAYSVPPGYRKQTPPKRPKLEPFTGVIDRILEDDLRRPRKQRHTAKRIFERLRDEYGFDGGYTTVKDYVREHRRQTREMFVPLSHPPGHAQLRRGSGGHRRGAAEDPLLRQGLSRPRPPRPSWTATSPPSPSWAACPRASCTTMASDRRNRLSRGTSSARYVHPIPFLPILLPEAKLQMSLGTRSYAKECQGCLASCGSDNCSKQG